MEKRLNCLLAAQDQLSKNDLRKIAIIFFSINLNMRFGAQKNRLIDWDGSFEYPQHMFWLRNKKNNFQLHILIWRPVADDSQEKSNLILSLKAWTKFENVCCIFWWHLNGSTDKTDFCISHKFHFPMAG